MKPLTEEFDKTEKHYHWTPKGDEMKSFAPFSHFGTAKAAEDRYKAPLGHPDATVGALKGRAQNLPPEGQTIPVHIDKTKVLHLGGDSGSHDPIQIAHSIREASDGHDTIDVSHHIDAHNVLNHVMSHWSDEDMHDWAKSNDVDYYTQEFGHKNISQTRRMWHEEVHRSVFVDKHGEYDPGASPDDRATRNVAAHNPEATAKAFEHIGHHLEKAGVTALSYENAQEDPGSTSWIVPHPKHVRSVHAAFKNPDNTDLMEDGMVTVAAIPGAGASSTPNNPNVSNFDEPFKGNNINLAALRRMLRRKQTSW